MGEEALCLWIILYSLSLYLAFSWVGIDQFQCTICINKSLNSINCPYKNIFIRPPKSSPSVQSSTPLAPNIQLSRLYSSASLHFYLNARKKRGACTIAHTRCPVARPVLSCLPHHLTTQLSAPHMRNSLSHPHHHTQTVIGPVTLPIVLRRRCCSFASAEWFPKGFSSTLCAHF